MFLQAAISGGLRFLEITLNTPNAFLLITKAIENFPEICIGAGTVLSVESAQKACDSGSQFIVAPSLDEKVAHFCANRKIAYFPGALTPTEIEKSWNSGATMVKIFPASQMGPNYFKNIKGPFDHIKLMAVGGVNSKNAHEYLASGASAVALGGSIFSQKRMDNQEYLAIQKDIEDFLFAVNRKYPNIKETDCANRSI